MEKVTDFEAWAEKLQNSKSDLIELLQQHMELVEENEQLNKRVENAIFTEAGEAPQPKRTIKL